MKLFFRSMAIVMTALLAVSIIGCGGDDDDDPVATVAAFESSTPADGGTLAANGSIKVTFDNNPGTVTVSAGTVEGSGKSRTIKGPFDVGSLALKVDWTNGDDSKTLNFTIEEADETAPEVVSSNPENGAKDLDPAKITEITVTFSEVVTGELKLMEGETDLDWESSADGDTITLKPKNVNQELSNETTYMVIGTVEDGSGNSTVFVESFSSPREPTEHMLSFTTKAKE